MDCTQECFVRHFGKQFAEYALTVAKMLILHKVKYAFTLSRQGDTERIEGSIKPLKSCLALDVCDLFLFPAIGRKLMQFRDSHAVNPGEDVSEIFPRVNLVVLGGGNERLNYEPR